MEERKELIRRYLSFIKNELLQKMNYVVITILWKKLVSRKVKSKLW